MQWRVAAVIAALALASVATADCPNACSGHGDCSTNNDYCKCYLGWMGNDCSQQLCPFGLSFVDSPLGDIDGDQALTSGGADTGHVPSQSGASAAGAALNPMFRPYGYWEQHPVQLYGSLGDTTSLMFPVQKNEGHFYTECSNRGTCDRATGLCSCFTGYEGAACNRTTCVNDCSGHGVCQYINDLTPEGMHYRLWDADKTRVCKCDGGYFGVDCSQRKCWSNDDPLTTKTTKAEWNSGLDERNEVQFVDIRCKHKGQILGPALISLTYTDVQTGDKYETDTFDLFKASVESDAIAALRRLPNEVLASYDITPQDALTSPSTFHKLVDVDVQAFDANNFYRLAVTFHHSLGNVPTLSGTPYFKCRGGAEVFSDKENVKVDYVGDGPAYDLRFDFGTITDAGANDQSIVTVSNYTTGAALAAGEFPASSTGVATITHPFANVQQVIGSATTTLGATSLNAGREAAKVLFTFGADADGHDSETLYIIIHVTPEITVKNQMFTNFAAGLSGDSQSSSVRKVVRLSGANHLTVDDSTFQPGTAAYPLVAGTGPYTSPCSATIDCTKLDFILGVVAVDAIKSRVTLNDEIVGLYRLGTAATVFTLTVVDDNDPAVNDIDSLDFGDGSTTAAWDPFDGAVAAQTAIRTLGAAGSVYKTAVVSFVAGGAGLSGVYTISFPAATSAVTLTASAVSPGTHFTATLAPVTPTAGTFFDDRGVVGPVTGLLDAIYGAYIDELVLTPVVLAAGNSYKAHFPKYPFDPNAYYPPAGRSAGWSLKRNFATGAGVAVPSTAFFSAGTIDDIWPEYKNFEAPLVPFTLIIQITKITTATDEYKWKLAGDYKWSDYTYTTQASGAPPTVAFGSQHAIGDITGAASTGQDLDNYGSNQIAYPNDDAHDGVDNIRLFWLSGKDNQKRLCGAEATYYMQFGSDGLNDAPECSDRGVCDYSSGVCKCFKGYAGIDCTTMNALSGGGSYAA